MLVGEALADALGASALVVNLEAAAAMGWSAADLVPIAAREAALAGDLLVLDRLGAVPAEQSPALGGLLWHCAALPQLVVICGHPPVAHGPEDIPCVTVELPTSEGRRARRWRHHLEAEGLWVDEEDIAGVARRLQLSDRQIASSTAEIAARARLEGDPRPLDGVAPVARRLAGAELDGLATKVVPLAGWDDLVLPDASMGQLEEMVRRLRSTERVSTTGDSPPRGSAAE